ncbi:MAG: DUF3971 domain-containing protein, partial [Gammaproteobacteria bacterium]
TVIKDINAILVHHFYQARLQGSASLFDSESKGEINVLLTFNPKSLAERKWNADLKLVAYHIDLPKWQQFWPKESVDVKSGMADIKVDLSWDENVLSEVTSSLLLKQLAVQYQRSTANKAPIHIELDSVSFDGAGKQNPSGWLVSTDLKVTPTSGGDVQANGNLLVPTDLDETQIELYLKAADLPAVTTLKTYLPNGLLPEKLTIWLHEAIQSGIAEEVNMVVRGPIKKIPFANQEGLFEIIVDYKDTDLFFNEHWPPLEKIQGQLIFHSNNFAAIINQGKMGGGDIVEAAVVIPDIESQEIVLNITGKVDGSAEDTIVFLKQTPIWPRLSTQLSPLNLKGPVELKVDMDVPLKDYQTKTQVFGMVNFLQASVGIPAVDLNFSDVKGEVTFDEHGVYADALMAKFYNHPVNIQFASQSGDVRTNPGFLEASMEGTIDIAALQQRYPNPLWARAQGSFPYYANLEWRHPDDPKPSRLQINTNLPGVTVDLPEPFNKTAQQEQPFFYQGEFGKTEQRQKIKYGNLLLADLYFIKQKNINHLTRGLVQIQSNSAANMT